MKTNYLLAVCISISVALSAQQNVEEVIVTAEKTEKNILDIGTTMNLYNEDFMEDQKITELGQLSYYVPNFTVQEEDDDQEEEDDIALLLGNGSHNSSSS